MIMAMKMHSDIVSYISNSDKFAADKCGPDMCSFDMAPDMIFDNPCSDKHSSDKCTLIQSDNPDCDK